VFRSLGGERTTFKIRKDGVERKDNFERFLFVHNLEELKDSIGGENLEDLKKFFIAC